ncbi:MAG: transcription termination/antitermination protein NusA [Parcubacteria group bacterium]|nr:transcription termination/antitermination protein NusA [Parcubacteria group bacterium]
MIDQKQFLSAIAQIAEEKGIKSEQVIATIELAIAAAYKKEYGEKQQIIRAKLDPETGKVKFSQIKIVLDESMIKKEEEIEQEISENRAVQSEKEEIKEAAAEAGSEKNEEITEKRVRFNLERHMMIDEAKKIKQDAKPGDELEFPLESRDDYGRIAAQTAKQVIIQRIREVERDTIYNEFKDKEGQAASGIVQRIEGRRVFVLIGKTQAILFPEEQIFGERYHIGSRNKFFILRVEKSLKGPGVILSRTHPMLVSRLFELEVPEISVGSVVIKSIAREAGSRTKIAVASTQERVDPVGSLVGQKGTRVGTVISELGGEKIDIIEWNEDQAKFIANALSPAKIFDVKIDEKTHYAKAEVLEDQFSLAIGKGGQNVRLAARLVGWKIDVVGIKSTGEAIEGLKEEAEAGEKEISEEKN